MKIVQKLLFSIAKVESTVKIIYLHRAYQSVLYMELLSK